MSTAPQLVQDKPKKRKQQTARTPMELRQVGVPSKTIEVRLSRLLWSLRGVRRSLHKLTAESNEETRVWLDKSATLREILPQVSARVLKQHGADRNYRRSRVGHKELAQRAGYAHRSSYSRNGRFTLDVLKKKRRFRQPNVYDWNFDEGENRGKLSPDAFCMPSLGELRKDPELGHLWDEKDANGGYAWIPGWIWHPSTPGTANDKLVLTYLASCGLFKIDDNGRAEGEINPRIGTIARAVSLSPTTVREALRFFGAGTWKEETHCPKCMTADNGERAWEYARNEAGEIVRDTLDRPIRRLRAPNAGCSDCGGTGKVVVDRRGIGLLRVIEQPGKWMTDSDGKQYWSQPPSKIIYLAGRRIDDHEAQLEAERFHTAAAAVGKRNAHWETCLAVHTALLREWLGTERQMRTFWRECRKQMVDKGVPAHFIQWLIPGPGYKPPPDPD